MEGSPDEGGSKVELLPVRERADDNIDAVEGDSGVGGAGVVHDRRAQVQRRPDGFLQEGIVKWFASLNSIPFSKRCMGCILQSVEQIL